MLVDVQRVWLCTCSLNICSVYINLLNLFVEKESEICIPLGIINLSFFFHLVSLHPIEYLLLLLKCDPFRICCNTSPVISRFNSF